MNKRWLILPIPVLLLAACGVNSSDEVSEWMKEEEKKIRPSITPLPKAIEYRSVAFDMQGSLDPFDTTRLNPDNRRAERPGLGGLEPDFEKRDLRNNILEKYPLESMTLIGIMNINGQDLGVIRVDNLTQQVKVGDYIGLDFGLITEIKDSELSLKEMVEDAADGIWMERTNTLYLQNKEEGR